MGLDWDLPSYPPPKGAAPLTMTVDLGELTQMRSDASTQRQVNAHDQQARTYQGLQQWDKAIAEYASALELLPNHALSHNNLAWLLATCPDAKFRDATAALEHATRAVELEPNAPHAWNTLGVAHYRTGNWHAAIESLQKAEQLTPGKYFGHNACFLAMAHWQLDEKDAARKWYDQAVQWMEKNQPQDQELRRFRLEAAELLGIKEKKE